MSEKEDQIRERVRELKSFYTNCLTLGGAAVISLFVWLLSGGGYFWPIWVITAAAISLGFQAFRLGMIPMVTEWFPFLKPEWESQQVDKFLGDGAENASKKSTTKKKDS